MFDPSTLDDPAALRTQWDPLVRGGASFTTHALHATPEGFEYRTNLHMKLFAGLFLVMGLVGTTMGVVRGEWFALVGLPFVVVGVLLLRPRPRRFDRVARAVTVGRKTIPFADVVALQLITEQVQGDERAYDSHELNLVLTDGSRVNVVDHAGKEALRTDMARLRELLGCKAWDATSA